MCDGITQGEIGMELSLFSRDVIAMSTAVALSHQTFDGMLLLGICDKIVPGLLIGALAFGHLPAMFVPSGPMPSGYSNDERKLKRQMFAEGKLSREELVEVEGKSFATAGTCTFYGTANTEHLKMPIIGMAPTSDGRGYWLAGADGGIFATSSNDAPTDSSASFRF